MKVMYLKNNLIIRLFLTYLQSITLSENVNSTKSFFENPIASKGAKINDSLSFSLSFRRILSDSEDYDKSFFNKMLIRNELRPNVGATTKNYNTDVTQNAVPELEQNYSKYSISSVGLTTKRNTNKANNVNFSSAMKPFLPNTTLNVTKSAFTGGQNYKEEFGFTSRLLDTLDLNASDNTRESLPTISRIANASDKNEKYSKTFSKDTVELNENENINELNYVGPEIDRPEKLSNKDDKISPIGDRRHGTKLNKKESFSAPVLAHETKLVDIWIQNNTDNDKFIINVKSKTQDKLIASAYLRTSLNQTGWHFLDVQAFREFPDHMQAYWAGYTEGCITASIISQHWLNTRNSYCRGVTGGCKSINKFLNQNTKWIRRLLRKFKEIDKFWWQVYLFYKQINGLYSGYKTCKSPTDYELTRNDFILMNSENDLYELKKKFNYEEKRKFTVPNDYLGYSTAIVKLLPENEDILIGHTKWNSYNYMTRMLKRYSIPYRMSNDQLNNTADYNFRRPNKLEDIVPGMTITFSGYPGIIYSADNFYVTSSKLVVAETMFGNWNSSLWKYVKPRRQILVGPRVMSANRLANNCKEWFKIFTRGANKGGTSSSQWLIVDFKKFKPKSKPKDDTLWVVDQIPTYVFGKDQTGVLLRRKHWGSFGVPVYKNIYIRSGYKTLAKKFGNEFTYVNAPIRKIINREAGKVLHFKGMIHMMRYNNYTKDPLSKCKCIPPYSASIAIAPRFDLNLKNKTYNTTRLGFQPGGAYDTKVTNFELAKTQKFMAVSGPTTGENIPIFKWSTSGIKDISYVGQPNEWNFNPVLANWDPGY